MAGNVFEEYPFEAGAKFTSDAGDIWPEMPFVACALALPGMAERLAGVSGKQRVEGPGERLCVEGCDIIPYWCRAEVSGPLASDEDRSRVFLPLDKASGVESGFGEHEAHIEATTA